MMWFEWFTIVFQDQIVNTEPGFGTQVTRKLPGVVAVYTDGAFRTAKDLAHFLRMKRSEVFELKMIGADTFVSKQIDDLTNDSLRRAPANQGNLGIGRAFQFGCR